MKKLYFLSGLPRAGSTLLASILNQRLDTHVSETSALMELLLSQANSIVYNKNLYNITDRQETNIYSGIINSFYFDIKKEIIIDKHRGWPSVITALKKMNINAKIICSNRNIADIITSYITLINKNPTSPNFIDETLIKKNLPINTHNRAMTIWSDYVQIPHNILINAINENPTNLLFINYNSIIENPLAELEKIEMFLDIPSYTNYQFKNIQNKNPEKDETGWRLKDLHSIRQNPIDVLGNELTTYFNQFNIKI